MTGPVAWPAFAIALHAAATGQSGSDSASAAKPRTRPLPCAARRLGKLVRQEARAARRRVRRRGCPTRPRSRGGRRAESRSSGGRSCSTRRAPARTTASSPTVVEPSSVVFPSARPRSAKAVRPFAWAGVRAPVGGDASRRGPARTSRGSAAKSGSCAHSGAAGLAREVLLLEGAREEAPHPGRAGRRSSPRRPGRARPRPSRGTRRSRRARRCRRARRSSRRRGGARGGAGRRPCSRRPRASRSRGRCPSGCPCRSGARSRARAGRRRGARSGGPPPTSASSARSRSGTPASGRRAGTTRGARGPKAAPSRSARRTVVMGGRLWPGGGRGGGAGAGTKTARPGRPSGARVHVRRDVLRVRGEPLLRRGGRRRGARVALPPGPAANACPCASRLEGRRRLGAAPCETGAEQVERDRVGLGRAERDRARRERRDGRARSGPRARARPCGASGGRGGSGAPPRRRRGRGAPPSRPPRRAASRATSAPAPRRRRRSRRGP